MRRLIWSLNMHAVNRLSVWAEAAGMLGFMVASAWAVGRFLPAVLEIAADGVEMVWECLHQ